MKIGQKRPSRLQGKSWLLIGALVLAFAIGVIVGTQEWGNPVDGLRTILSRLTQPRAPAEDLPVLMIDMRYELVNELNARRAEALNAGVYIPSAQDFVTATISLNSTQVPVRMRLLAGPADHLGPDDKWGYEVRTRRNQQLLGMQRFYLLDPEANNWLNQWAFAQTLQREGVLVARYQFVHLIYNGTDRGIYALQEGFGSELLTAQGRAEGVIVEFDADLLWESIVHFQGNAQAAYADPVANLSSADFRYLEVDAFRDATVADDPALSAQKDAAIGLLRALQTGQLAASDVFDVEQYGRFMALVDLWGATQGMSLVNLRYYYSPVSGRLEPIGFNANALDLNALGPNARISLATTYDDPALQAAYVQETLRVSQPEYLDQLQAQLEPEFRRLQQAVERTDISPPWDQLRARQEQMRRSLNPVQPVFAYLGSPTLATSGILRVDVANVLNLPVEIVGFDVHGATFLPASRQWIQGEPAETLIDDADSVILRAFDADRTPVLRYVRFDIPLAEIHRLDSELDFMQELDIQVNTRILGLSTTQLTLARSGYPDILILGPEE